MHIDRFDGVFGGWYAVVRGRETKVHLTRLGAFLDGLRLTVRLTVHPEPKGER